MLRTARSLGRQLGLPLLAAASAWAAVSPALARDLSGPERAGLSDVLARFASATRDGDGAGVAATLPPRVVSVIAAERGIDSQAERRAIADQIAAIQKADVRKNVTFDLDHAAFGSLRDGTPYAVVPLHDVAEGAKSLDMRVHALALMDEGKWYLLALGTPERLVWLRKAYPAFDGVTLDGAPAVGTP